MMRLLGAAMVAGVCAWLGFFQAARLKKRVNTLAHLESGFTLLYQRLDGGDGMPRMMADLARSCGGAAGDLFGFCARELVHRERESFPSVWQRGLEGNKDMDQTLRERLRPLGNTLGQCALEDQRRAVDGMRVELSAFRQRAEEEFLRQGRLYRTLGISGGAFLVILLL